MDALLPVGEQVEIDAAAPKVVAIEVDANGEAVDSSDEVAGVDGDLESQEPQVENDGFVKLDQAGDLAGVTPEVGIAQAAAEAPDIASKGKDESEAVASDDAKSDAAASSTPSKRLSRRELSAALRGLERGENTGGALARSGPGSD